MLYAWLIHPFETTSQLKEWVFSLAVKASVKMHVLCFRASGFSSQVWLLDLASCYRRHWTLTNWVPVSHRRDPGCVPGSLLHPWPNPTITSTWRVNQQKGVLFFSICFFNINIYIKYLFKYIQDLNFKVPVLFTHWLWFSHHKTPDYWQECAYVYVGREEWRVSG